MANVDELRRWSEARTVAGLTARLATAEAAIETLHRALFAEVREGLSGLVPTDEEVRDYITRTYGIGRVKETT